MPKEIYIEQKDNKSKNEIQEIARYLFFEENGRIKTECIPLLIYSGFCLLMGIIRKIWHDLKR